MDVYVLSAHGSTDFSKPYKVPANVSVVFYTAFGQPLDNAKAKEIQTAVAHGHPSPYPSVAIYNGGSMMPGSISVTGDNQIFYSGIVEAPNATVIMQIGAQQLYSLDYLLTQVLLKRSPNGLTLHYLACLSPAEYHRYLTTQKHSAD